MKPVVLWDLDGTLTNPAIGIVKSIQFALEQTKRPVPEFRELLWVIGPPIQNIFAKLDPSANEEEIWKMIGKYRERYGDVGMFENEVYPEIPETLKATKTNTKYVCTSKPLFFAKKIMDHFDLSKHFLKIYGANLDGTLGNKGELIEHILKMHQLNPKNVVIVGDREHDVLGAKRAGISSIGVTWGFGTREELEKAGADAIVNTPAELLKLLNS